MVMKIVPDQAMINSMYLYISLIFLSFGPGKGVQQDHQNCQLRAAQCPNASHFKTILKIVQFICERFCDDSIYINNIILATNVKAHQLLERQFDSCILA